MTFQELAPGILAIAAAIGGYYSARTVNRWEAEGLAAAGGVPETKEDRMEREGRRHDPFSGDFLCHFEGDPGPEFVPVWATSAPQAAERFATDRAREPVAFGAPRVVIVRAPHEHPLLKGGPWRVTLGLMWVSCSVDVAQS